MAEQSNMVSKYLWSTLLGSENRILGHYKEFVGGQLKTTHCYSNNLFLSLYGCAGFDCLMVETRDGGTC